MSTVRQAEVADVFDWNYWGEPTKATSVLDSSSSTPNSYFDQMGAFADVFNEIASGGQLPRLTLESGQMFDLKSRLFAAGSIIRFRLERLQAVLLPLPKRNLETLGGIRETQKRADAIITKGRLTYNEMVGGSHNHQINGVDDYEAGTIRRYRYDAVDGTAVYIDPFFRPGFYGIAAATKDSVRQMYKLKLPQQNPAQIGKTSIALKEAGKGTIYNLERIQQVEVYDELVEATLFRSRLRSALELGKRARGPLRTE